MQRKQTDVM